MKGLITIILTLSCFGLFGQTKGELTWRFSGGFGAYAMNNLNELLVDTSTYFPYRLDSLSIKNGAQFRFDIAYRPLDFFSVGCYTSYQNGRASAAPDRMRIIWPTGDTIHYKASSSVEAQSFGIGFISTLHINSLLNLNERFVCGIELSGGIAFSNLRDNVFDPIWNSESRLLSHASQDFQGSVALNTGCRITKKPNSLRAGLRLGYQILNTKALRSGNGTAITGLANREVSLDFSGFFTGIYIELGR